MNILCIETATTACSVCVAHEQKLLAIRETNEGYTHAENLHVFVEQVLAEAGMAMKDLGAVAVSKGPGSYTGLRIGASAAKGFCYALSIPLVAIDTLQAMARQVSQSHPGILYCPMLDARRMEVYCALYNARGEALLPVQALVLDEITVKSFERGGPVCFFGDGMPKGRELLASLEGAVFVEGIAPSARDLAPLAFEKLRAGKCENLGYFEPFYLKEFFTKKP
jgi:tRNA threonylcarbamoyladenosine biosynthesis protein TsaB